ncbi:MAG: hypothetical protein V3S13_02050, partial [Candidatus Omnitrophota bacterium]
MRKIGILLFIIFSCLLVYALVNIIPNTHILEVADSRGVGLSSDLPFKKGERFTYEVRCNRLKVGRSTLTFNGEKDLDGRKVYHITFFTKVPSLR